MKVIKKRKLKKGHCPICHAKIGHAGMGSGFLQTMCVKCKLKLYTNKL